LKRIKRENCEGKACCWRSESVSLPEARISRNVPLTATQSATTSLFASKGQFCTHKDTKGQKANNFTLVVKRVDREKKGCERRVGGSTGELKGLSI
jgi:hypothetical protein